MTPRFHASLLVMLMTAFSWIASAAPKAEVKKPGFLTQLKEPTLTAQPKDSNVRIYRLIIAPTWGNRICFRFQNTSTGGTLVMKRLDGQAGYGDGPLKETKEHPLTAEEFQAFEKLVDASGYKKMESTDPDAGMDGDTWTLEVSKAGFHHEAGRWCPNAFEPRKRGTLDYVKVFRWAADKSGVTKALTNKGHPVFDR